MQIQDILYYLFWAGLFFAMMRFGCGAHVMGHGHHKNASEPDQASRTSVPSVPLDRVTDPVCGKTVKAAAAKTAVYQGQVYYFCSQNCREKFEAAPASYAKSQSMASPQKEHQHGCC
ncbi:MAG TPA: YHS domain-containing protein [Rhodopila sp.]|nr:YHS domain-containing protein [Rhodopila sp.]